MKEEYEQAQKTYFDLADKVYKAKKPSKDLVADFKIAEREFMAVKGAWESNLNRISRSATAGVNPLMAAIGGGGAKLKETETKDSSGPNTTGGSKDKRKKSALTLEMEARLASMRQSKKESPAEYAKRLSDSRKKTKKTKTKKTKKTKEKTKEERYELGEETWTTYDRKTRKIKLEWFRNNPAGFKKRHSNVYEFLVVENAG